MRTDNMTQDERIHRYMQAPIVKQFVADSAAYFASRVKSASEAVRDWEEEVATGCCLKVSSTELDFHASCNVYFRACRYPDIPVEDLLPLMDQLRYAIAYAAKDLLDRDPTTDQQPNIAFDSVRKRDYNEYTCYIRYRAKNGRVKAMNSW